MEKVNCSILIQCFIKSNVLLNFLDKLFLYICGFTWNRSAHLKLSLNKQLGFCMFKESKKSMRLDQGASFVNKLCLDIICKYPFRSYLAHFYKYSTSQCNIVSLIHMDLCVWLWACWVARKIRENEFEC